METGLPSYRTSERMDKLTKIVEVRLPTLEVRALMDIANKWLMAVEKETLQDRRAQEAMKRIVTAMGYVPESYGGMVNIGRKVPHDPSQ
jgi:hypothetical protein